MLSKHKVQLVGGVCVFAAGGLLLRRAQRRRLSRASKRKPDVFDDTVNEETAEQRAVSTGAIQRIHSKLEPLHKDDEGVGYGIALAEGHLKDALSTMSAYKVDPARGFLPSRDPIHSLGPKYAAWEDLGTELPALLSTGKLRSAVKNMPLVSWEGLIGQHDQLRRAFLVLTALHNAYLWCDPEAPVDSIPKNLAVPLCGVAAELGLAPTIMHASMVLYNWRRLDPCGPIDTSNITMLLNFLGGRDEMWFFLVTVEIEMHGAAALLPCLLAQKASKALMSAIAVRRAYGGSDATTLQCWCAYLTALLGDIHQAILAMTASFKRMYDKCDPYIFYHRVRPWVSGTKNNPTMPNGVIYEGVYDGARQQFAGGSAAQSSLLPVFDAVLGVSHKAADSLEFLDDMQSTYMPRGHREFIRFVREQSPGIRDLLTDDAGLRSVFKPDDPNLIEVVTAYDAAIHALTTFRNLHMEIVKVYIIAEMEKVRKSTRPDLGDAAGGKGTGGTALMSFLQPLRDDTRDKALLGEGQKAVRAA